MNRQALKQLAAMVDGARRLAAPMIECAPELKIDVALIINGLVDAETHIAYLLDATSIRDGERMAPLDNTEEEFFLNLKSHLVKRDHLTDEQFDRLTHSQKFSAARVMARNIPPSGVFLTDHLGLRFPHIYIGIEEDGYAHS